MNSKIDEIMEQVAILAHNASKVGTDHPIVIVEIKSLRDMIEKVLAENAIEAQQNLLVKLANNAKLHVSKERG